MAVAVPLPADHRILCSVCATLLPIIEFGPAQRSKQHPRCRACAPNKFSNQVTASGHQSRRESRRAQELATMQQAGIISDLRQQVRYELIPAQLDPATGKIFERPLTYIADFVYQDCLTGAPVVEDAKGMRTDTYIVKRKLMLWVHHIRIQEV